jgi:hypothetical protein
MTAASFLILAMIATIGNANNLDITRNLINEQGFLFTMAECPGKYRL